MMVRTCLGFTAALIFASGCGARPPAGPTVDLQSGARVAQADADGDRHEILVWVKNNAEEPKTFRLAAEGALRVLGEEPGIVIATSRGELKWQVTEKQLNLGGCDGSPAEVSKGIISPASLVAVKGNEVQRVVDPSEDGGELGDLQHHATVVGSVGPYLFIAETCYMFACGAHGGTTWSAFIWDAEAGRAVDLVSQFSAMPALTKEAEKNLSEDGNAGTTEDEAPHAEPVRLVPVYGERGALRIEVQFAAWACYACSDGQWSSYTRSTFVPTEWIPEQMKAWVMPPVVVKEFLETHKGWRLGGWSKR